MHGGGKFDTHLIITQSDTSHSQMRKFLTISFNQPLTEGEQTNVLVSPEVTIMPLDIEQELTVHL